jgi:hypothetical protein
MVHPNDLNEGAGRRRFSIARAAGRLGAALKQLHRGIVRAKMRRLRREMMSHTGKDAGEFPQQPLILDDKWDS